MDNLIRKYETKIKELYFSKSILTLSNWMKTVEQFSETQECSFLKSDPKYEEKFTEIKNKFKGDMFEILAYLFFSSFESDEYVGVKNYKRISPGQDYGVDAIDENVIGTKCLVQVKYRNNPNDLITWEDLAKTVADGLLRHGIDSRNDNCLILFTTSRDADYVAKNCLNKSLRVINRKTIQHKT